MRESDSIPGRIRRVSMVMVGVTAALGLFVIGAYVFLWVDGDALRGLVLSELVPSETAVALDGWQKAAVLGARALPMAIALWGLWNALHLFLGFAAGAVFVVATGRRLARMGAALALAPFAQVIATGIGSAAATFDNPPGERLLAFSVSSEVLFLAFLGVLLLTVGWVMAEAAQIAEENRQFV